MITKQLIVSKKQKDRSSMFAGSASLVKSDSAVEKQLILLVAEAFGVPAICVNVMGGLPYINKDGLSFKLEEYEGSKIISLVSEAKQLSTKPGERAIFETRLSLAPKNKGGLQREFSAIGEADEANTKLAAVKATPNLMAETRSQNRCIRKAIQARMLKDLYTKLGDQKMDPQEKEIIEGAIQTSAEEMNINPTKREANKQQMIDEAMKMISTSTDAAALEDWEKKVSSSKIYTIKEKVALRSAIMNRIKIVKNDKA